MPCLNYDQMARELFALILEVKLESSITPEELHSKGVVVSLVSLETGKRQCRISAAGPQVAIQADAWFTTVNGLVYGSAGITYLVNTNTGQPLEAPGLVTKQFLASAYTVECDCN